MSILSSVRFVAADVYNAVQALGGETFDIVYTGFGAVAENLRMRVAGAVLLANRPAPCL